MKPNVRAAPQHSGTVRTGGAPSSVYEEGRVCAHRGCDVRLSIYNPGPGCNRHRSLNRNWRVRGQRVEPVD